ncbi:hypothetical protein DESA109040_01235 [Deinococcus saxicola]
MWNGINLTELLEKSVPPKPKSTKVLDALIVISLVLIVGSKLLAPRPPGSSTIRHRHHRQGVRFPLAL